MTSVGYVTPYSIGFNSKESETIVHFDRTYGSDNNPDKTFYVFTEDHTIGSEVEDALSGGYMVKLTYIRVYNNLWGECSSANYRIIGVERSQDAYKGS